MFDKLFQSLVVPESMAVADCSDISRMQDYILKEGRNRNRTACGLVGFLYLCAACISMMWLLGGPPATHPLPTLFLLARIQDIFLQVVVHICAVIPAVWVMVMSPIFFQAVIGEYLQAWRRLIIRICMDHVGDAVDCSEGTSSASFRSDESIGAKCYMLH